MSLTEGPVWKKFCKLWWPMIGGIVAVKAIDLSDAYFVGQLGEGPLAAISFTFPVVMTLVSIAIGLSAGASSILSRAIGKGADSDAQQEIVAGALVIGLLVSLVISITGFVSAELIFTALGAKDEVLAMTIAYMQIWFGGIFLLILPVAINGMIRARGDSITPSLLMTATAIINIGLNPVFIYGLGPVPAFGMEGAAWATLCARLLLIIAAFYILFKREMLSLQIQKVLRGLARWRELAKIGLPASLSTSLNPIAMSVITAGVATLGNAEVAAFGVVSKIQAFALVPMLALSAAASPFVGQNSGGDKHERSRQALYLCSGISVVWTILVSAFLYFCAPWLVSLFDGSESSQDAAVIYLVVVPITTMGYGIIISLSAAMNGLGRASTGLLIGGIRTVLLLAPLGYFGALYFGFVGMSIGVAISNVLAGIAGFIIIRKHSFKTA